MAILKHIPEGVMGVLQIDYDYHNDVLYLKRQEAQIVNSQECDNDSEIVRNYDEDGNVVGLIFLGPNVITASNWSEHPDRNELPEDMVEVLDDWIFNGIRQIA